MAVVGVAGEDDDDEDIFEDPDEPIVKKQKKATKPKGAAREYNVDGSRKKRAIDNDDIDEVVLQQQEQYALELNERAKAMAEQAAEQDVPILRNPRYRATLEEAEQKLTEVWEEGKPSERGLLLLGHLARMEKKADEKPDERTLEERLSKAATYYYAAVTRYNSTEAIYLCGKIIQLQGELKGKQGDKKKQEELFYNANEFYGSATTRGHMQAMNAFAEMCKAGKGWPDNVCPYNMTQQVYKFYEALANETPGASTYSRVAYAWAEGFGKDRIGMPEACEWNDKAIKANEKAIKDGKGKIKFSEMKKKGIEVDAYLLRAACQYCGNFVGTGSPDMRVDARNTLKKMLKMQNMKKKDRDAKFAEIEKKMFGPKDDPDLVGSIRWDRDVDGYGLKWYFLIWGNQKIGYVYSTSRRDTHQCNLLIGKAEDDVPIFQCQDARHGLRLIASEVAEDGKIKGTAFVKTKSGPVTGAFDMEPSIPLHTEM